MRIAAKRHKITKTELIAAKKHKKRKESENGRSSFQEFLRDRKSTRLNSSHGYISYAVFCLKKKKKPQSRRHKNTYNAGVRQRATHSNSLYVHGMPPQPVNHEDSLLHRACCRSCVTIAQREP